MRIRSGANNLEKHPSKFTNPKLIPAPWGRDKLRLVDGLEKGRKNEQASEFPKLPPRFGRWTLLVFTVKRRLAIIRPL
ncbi:MAG: hypothetical protein QM780_17035 [Hyphomicrobium sp.]|uniref:hypothetical protein n=1 Tax=Hyphomicrobium sp. TaxID=82 RepID=UPI0039E4EF5F